MADHHPSTAKLSPERSVRLLRAKAAELEEWYGTGDTYEPMMQLAAEIALVATLLADEIERHPDTSGPIGRLRLSEAEE